MAASTQKVVLGAMTFGKEGAEQTRVFTLDGCNAILDIFQAHGHDEVDTARVYGGGSSEQFLGDLNWKKRGLVMDTKYYPTPCPSAMRKDVPEGGWRHTPEHLRVQLDASLKALKADKVDMWYLHGPDRTTPYEITMKAVDELYKEGKFARFGISNYMAWEVAQICEISKANGYVIPSVYQGVYNALHRSVETELFSCLRHYGISFYAFNPLAGGYLTSRYSRDTSEIEAGSRFDPNRSQGAQYRKRYWNDAYFDALDLLRPVANKHGLTEAECALRWMTHHSVLRKDLGDAIIIGASSTKHMEENMKFLDNENPLPEEVIKALDAGWARCRGDVSNYFH